jgi:hypothetical protein
MRYIRKITVKDLSKLITLLFYFLIKQSLLLKLIFAQNLTDLFIVFICHRIIY